MFKMIKRPADCEIWSVIRFLNARNRQIYDVYGENAVSDGMVRKWLRECDEGRDNVHDEPRSGRVSSQEATFYEERQKLVSCYDRCLNSGGTYVEK
jgi:hypothetical protein